MTGRWPKLSVVIPAYNEDQRLLKHLLHLLPALHTRFGHSFEVIVVDDGSDRPLFELLRPLAHEARLRIIRHERNRGKGAALRSGFLAAKGRYVLFADADGATPPQDLFRLVQAVSAGAAIATGCRVRGLARGWVQRSWYRRLAGRLFALATRWITGNWLVDPQIGFKALDRERLLPIVRHATEHGYLFDLELLLHAQRHGHSIRAVAVHWSECRGSQLKLLRDGRRMLGRLLSLRHRVPDRSRRQTSHTQGTRLPRHRVHTAQPPNQAPAAPRFQPHIGHYEHRAFRRLIFEPTYRHLVQVLNGIEGTVLDVGAGSGELGRLLSTWHGHLHYVALDPSPRGRFGCCRVRAVAEALPFASGTFDTVLCVHAAHHFRAPRQAWQEAARVLKPAGKLIIVDGEVDSSLGYMVHQVLIRALEGDVRFWRRQQWEQMLSGHGFRPQRCWSRTWPLPVLILLAVRRKNTRKPLARGQRGTC